MQHQPSAPVTPPDAYFYLFGYLVLAIMALGFFATGAYGVGWIVDGLVSPFQWLLGSDRRGEAAVFPLMLGLLHLTLYFIGRADAKIRLIMHFTISRILLTWCSWGLIFFYYVFWALLIAYAILRMGEDWAELVRDHSPQGLLALLIFVLGVVLTSAAAVRMRAYVKQQPSTRYNSTAQIFTRCTPVFHLIFCAYLLSFFLLMAATA